jgi:hypothetical protein
LWGGDIQGGKCVPEYFFKLKDSFWAIYLTRKNKRNRVEIGERCVCILRAGSKQFAPLPYLYYFINFLTPMVGFPTPHQVISHVMPVLIPTLIFTSNPEEIFVNPRKKLIYHILIHGPG